MNAHPAFISMLHEPAGSNSATRLFRHQPVLAWTLDRAARAQAVSSVTLLCWDDQLSAVRELADRAGAQILVKSPRTAIPTMDAVTAALKWHDGWRGALLGACHFDEGFHAPFLQEALRATASQATDNGQPTTDNLLFLINPSAALIDPDLINTIARHAAQHPTPELYFTQAAPGLAPVLLKSSLVDRLAKTNAHPGQLLAYTPDLPARDPMTTDMCVPVPPAIARITHRFTLDSDRQIRRLSAATADLNGSLIKTDAPRLAAILSTFPHTDQAPREITLELTTRRATKPIYAPTTHLPIQRDDLSLAAIENIFKPFQAVDDLRLTLAGAGDPALHPHFPQIINALKQQGTHSIHVETDLLDVSDQALATLASPAIDILTLHIPALTAQTYHRVMGVDGYAQVIANFKKLLSLRQGRLPIIVPTFTKCRINLEEMEPWYDQWLRALGVAVITGPSTFASQIPNQACADMSPPTRRPCTRINHRMTVLSDQSIPQCDQDIQCAHPLGHLTAQPLPQIWQSKQSQLIQDHATQQLKKRPLCEQCNDWQRP